MSEDDFSGIVDNLESISEELSDVSSRIQTVDDKVDDIASDLQNLSDQFLSFLDTYSRNTEIQLAETRINTVRQRLEKEFGHYADVRRHTSGILHAVDANLVRQETIRVAAENLMISTPRYWLTPCLMALSAWINNESGLAERAKSEAIRRNDERASLFFSLVCRRGNRYNASRMWLDRYLAMQDPTALPRDMVVVVDAYANGIFGPDIDGLCIKRFQWWMEELLKEPGFEERQVDQWKAALLSVRQDRIPVEEGYLKNYSPTWPVLLNTLSGAHIHASLFDYFTTVFDGLVEPSDGIAGAVDGMLDTLVSDYDEEELDLKNDERALALIIEEGGDRERANRRLTLEQRSTLGTVDFTQVLTNASLHPEMYASSLTCRKFSIALSKDWIIEAYKMIKAENRQSVPHAIEFRIDTWSGSTVNGGNETELIESIKNHIDQDIARTLVDTKLDRSHWIPGIIGSFILLGGLATLNIVGIIIGAVGLGWLGYQYSKVAKKKNQVKMRFAKLQTDMENIVRAMLAEVVDWRTAYAKEDAHGQRVDTLLETITPGQYVGRSYQAGRTIMTQPGGDVMHDTGAPDDTGPVPDSGSPLASQFPSWDLLPPVTSTRRKAA